MSVYLRAAEIVANESYEGNPKEHPACCTAMRALCERGLCSDAKYFAAKELFADTFCESPLSFWWGPVTNEANRQPRVLALLFMHWMTENP